MWKTSPKNGDTQAGDFVRILQFNCDGAHARQTVIANRLTEQPRRSLTARNPSPTGLSEPRFTKKRIRYRLIQRKNRRAEPLYDYVIYLQLATVTTPREINTSRDATRGQSSVPSNNSLQRVQQSYEVPGHCPRHGGRRRS